MATTSTTTPNRPTVLYLDDEAGNLLAFKASFRHNFHVLTATNLDQAWRLLEGQEVHVVISDQRMPGLLGSEVLRQIKERYPQTKRMLITAFADLQALVDALNSAGVCHYIHKPWEVADVLAAVETAWADWKTERERELFTAKLLESNQQLEFALRQSLLS